MRHCSDTETPVCGLGSSWIRWEILQCINVFTQNDSVSGSNQSLYKLFYQAKVYHWHYSLMIWWHTMLPVCFIWSAINYCSLVNIALEEWMQLVLDQTRYKYMLTPIMTRAPIGTVLQCIMYSLWVQRERSLSHLHAHDVCLFRLVTYLEWRLYH